VKQRAEREIDRGRLQNEAVVDIDGPGAVDGELDVEGQDPRGVYPEDPSCPASAFVSGSLLISMLTYSGIDTSHAGLTGRLSLGKEWWVSPSWSLGLAGEVLLGRMQSVKVGYPGESVEYTTEGFSLRFSSSFSYPPGPAPEAPPPDEPAPSVAGERVHDGLYVNARLGVGMLYVKTPEGDTISGSSYPLALAAGFSLTGGLVLFGEFYRESVMNPLIGVTHLANLDLQGAGAGAKYYFMPRNIFVSAAAIVTQVSLHNDAPSDPLFGAWEVSPWGFTGLLSAGKEWWLTSNWGLGFSVEGFLGRFSPYSAKGLSLLISASFN